jgi:PAS domain S-box-containing protein
MSPLHHLYSPLIDHSPLAVYLHDFEGRIRLTNPAAVAMTGFSMEELKSMTVMDLDPAFPSLEILQDLWSALPVNEQIKMISTHRTKNGAILDIELHVAKIVVDGQTLFYGNVKNITEDLRVHRELEQNHEMLTKLARQVPGVVYQYRLYPDGRSCFPYSSPGMLDIYGHTPEEVREDATPVFLRLHPEDIDRVSRDIFKSAEDLSLFECRYRVILPEKGVQWRHSNARPERLPDGSTLWYGIITDITDKVLAEQEVIKLSSAIEQSPATVVITNLKGHIEYVNPKFTALTGYTAEEALGNNPRILKSGAQDDAYYSELWNTISAGNVWRGQFQNRKKNGELYWEAATISPIRDLNGVITHFLAVKEDITESVKNLDRVKKLLDVEEEQNKRLRNFTHIVSHNLRSHTANMAGVFGLLTMEEPELLENLYVRMLKTSADNLSETIVNLNAVLDINLGNNVTWSFQNLNSAAKTAMSSISTLAKTMGVRLINDVSDDFTLFVIPAYLDSILLNMLTNGIKFRGPDRDAYVRLSATKDGKRTVITIEDNGLGVDLEIHGAKMFGLYKTFHQNTDSKGLGLFITKNQIEAMGGTVIVNSKVDVGTTFVITLPNEKF